MKRVYGFSVLLFFLSTSARSQDVNLSSQIDSLSAKVERLSHTINLLVDVLNTTNSVTKEAAGALKSVGKALEDTKHLIEAKASLTFMAQMTALVVAGGTAMGLGVYVIYRLLTYKAFQNFEVPNREAVNPLAANPVAVQVGA